MRQLRDDMQATLARVRIEQEQALYLAQRAYLNQVLEEARGNVKRAAQLAGLSRSTMHKKLVSAGLHFISVEHQRKTIEGLHHLARARMQLRQEAAEAARAVSMIRTRAQCSASN